MSYQKTIFLSAAPPNCTSIQFISTLKAFLSIALGKTDITFGGHPLVTELILEAADQLFKVSDEYLAVTRYVSQFFEIDYVHSKYMLTQNIPAVNGDIKANLSVLRDVMLDPSHNYDIGVFLGGRGGVYEEYCMFLSKHPKATVIVDPSTEGDAEKIAKQNFICIEKSQFFL